MPTSTSLLCAALTSALIVTGITAALASPAHAATVCDVLTSPVYQRYNPSTRVTLLTLSANEAAASAAAGYSEDHGTPFYAANAPANGLYGAHLVERGTGGNRVYMPNPREAANAVTRYGYTDRGIEFYVPTAASACTVPVNRYEKSGRHTYATSAAENAALVSAGWAKEGVTFYGGRLKPSPPVDPTFSIAVYPDTQQEVGTDSRYLGRATDLLERRSELDLRFVTTSGDNVNWDTPDHAQYEVISRGLRPFEKAGIPYSLSNGNHDNQATGPGGGARDARNTRTLFRDTSTMNSFFPASRLGAVQGVYEAGKIDNAWSGFTAGGEKWMVLNLEMWPRLGAVEWAKDVVASHPDYNVIIATHSYLNSNGSITQCTYTRCSYGDASPQYLYDKLISQYANVKVTLSGHTGQTGMRIDTGVHGNKIVSYLTTIHSNTTNPIRIIEIDTAADTAKTWVYGPYGNVTFPAASNTQTKMGWVKD
ncbi:MAG TPA: hypothetical protein VIT20_08960 [Propionibacteriaceae bacterium]